MSTKALEELLSQYEDMIGSSTSEVGTAAKAELEAIRKAAKLIYRATVDGWPTTEMGSLHLQHAFEMFGVIAKEEPHGQ